MHALELLRTGTESYHPYLQPSGELHDPVFGVPTQYGTPYHALCNAALATLTQGEVREGYLERARRGLDAALKHLEDPHAPATSSGFDEETGATAQLNHRDFFWPPVLKTYRLLRTLGVPEMDDMATRIAAVDIESVVRQQPPSNWAAVWLSGEWLRIREGLSPHSLARFDAWLEPFFQGPILLEQGLYQEPGHPNSYDLFTRYHLADILLEGYQGRWREALETLMDTGLRRSLAVQLSDGSLASAHRSSGQTWTLGAQCAYFTQAATYFRSRAAEKSRAAHDAARRALTSLARYQRDAGLFSPVENCLPPGYRVGYERYTADGHYASLALAFLAVALLNGFDEDGLEPSRVTPKGETLYLEHDPCYRALVHHGPYSVHLNAFPAPAYDAFGITDLTTGPGRYLHFASSVQHLRSGRFYNLGMACRAAAGRAPLTVMAQQEFALKTGFERVDAPLGVRLEGRAKGAPHSYRLAVSLSEAGVRVEEATPGRRDYKTLLIPYLRDPGTGRLTEVEVAADAVHLRHGAEHLEISLEQAVEAALVLPHGYQNRRGLCGLIRLDLAEPREGLAYTLKIRA